eukprot:13356283-Heterocapsa_arctica.AAC.1
MTHAQDERPPTHSMLGEPALHEVEEHQQRSLRIAPNVPHQHIRALYGEKVPIQVQLPQPQL